MTAGQVATGFTGIQLAKVLGAGTVITATTEDNIILVNGFGTDVVVDYHEQNIDTLGHGGSNGTRALGTVEDADLEVAEATSCDGEMLENMWQTGPCLLTPRRGLAVAVMDRFLCAIRGTRSAVTVEGDRAVFLRFMQIVTSAVRMLDDFVKEVLPLFSKWWNTGCFSSC